MLHPGLGSPLDPLASWQVDTQEIGDVVGLYERHLSDESDPVQFTRRLGMLWKKLGTTPRLARLIVDYAYLRIQASVSSNESGRRAGPLLLGRVLAALGWNSSRSDARPRPVLVEDDPLYDYWVDG